MAKQDTTTARAGFERAILSAVRGTGDLADVNCLIGYLDRLPRLPGRKRTPDVSGSPAQLALEG